MMDFSHVFLNEFIDSISILSANSESIIKSSGKMGKDFLEKDKSDRIDNIRKLEKKTMSEAQFVDSNILDFGREIEELFSQERETKNDTLERYLKLERLLKIVETAEETINKGSFPYETKNVSDYDNLSLEEFERKESLIISKVFEVNKYEWFKQKEEYENEYASFRALCERGKQLIQNELELLCKDLLDDNEQFVVSVKNAAEKSMTEMDKILMGSYDLAQKALEAIKTQEICSNNEKDKFYEYQASSLQEKLQDLENKFIEESAHQELLTKYAYLYGKEPCYENYQCADEMPDSIKIGDIEFELSSLKLNDFTKKILNKYYFYIYKDNMVNIPFSVSFGKDFNFLFRFMDSAREKVVKDACGLGMRLFMMLPPGKLNFTFIDPVTLGESFAMFTRFVDIDDRTSEIINGKIWSTPADIESKLRIMTDHISNVTQRYLQGKYENIYQYNCVAEDNSEAYQVLMLMDFPAGFSDQALKYLEQIVTSGPKCGVFTIIYQNDNQIDKRNERSNDMITNISKALLKFEYDETGDKIRFSELNIKNKPVFLKKFMLPEQKQMEAIIETIRKSIKGSNRVVIGIDKVNEAETNSSTKNGFRIPIGIHGANAIQYLTLGSGGSHHALVGGMTRSGKSSLLHTIILQALSRYKSPDELAIYLIDFKRGVEFKIYADYILPVFKVIAIETEREFGYNVLVDIEREQKIRADLFKRTQVDKIEEYRELPEEKQKYKMPRVLVIMDEFHELFSNNNDEIGKKSSELIERIVRQGAGFGIHLILSSQSYSNIAGIDKAVFDQMAVRIVLKCSKADANLLLEDGGNEIDQISIDDPGRAIYNSEAGNKEYNSHFRVAYIDPGIHRSMLQTISDETRKYANLKKPTRILLSNIEDNKYSIFNQFSNYAPEDCSIPGRLYIGESLTIENNINIDMMQAKYANMLIVGPDSETARSMFAFVILSLAINYWVSHGKKHPSEPFIYLLNYAPLRDSFYDDIPKLIATKLLKKYIVNLPVADYDLVQEVVTELHERSQDKKDELTDTDKYLMVFGFQRAEYLKSTEKEQKEDNILDMMSNMNDRGTSYSMREMLDGILIDGGKRGIHTIMWQDDFRSLDEANRKMITYFYHKIAFGMSKEDFSNFVGVNDVSQLGTNAAVYSSRTEGTTNFRPYQTPDKEWVETICQKLQ